jgi:hypothetical protein
MAKRAGRREWTKDDVRDAERVNRPGFVGGHLV